MKHYFIIETLDGTTYDSRDYGIKIIDIDVPSVEWEAETDDVPGRPGVIELGSKATRGAITIEFDFLARDLVDYPLVRNAIYRLFSRKELFYLTESREPGKRFKVRSQGFSPRQRYTKGRTVISFNVPDVFAESRLTSTQAWNVNSDKIQFGLGIPGDRDLTWRFTTTTFEVFNPGDIEVDPNYMPLEIRFRGVSNGLVIRNDTTGAIFRYSGTTNTSDIIRLEKGCRPTKNRLTILDETNFPAYLTLVPGVNKFTVQNTTGGIEVIFDTPFYYE
ncbi:phage tail family protein [Alkalicoccobacillus gibsonii]|uniref:phage tail family protein n=1 Tax=Alkalicoccobacillus gibsonii TaxID=79881 RepID=UPI003F7C404C